MRVGKIFCYGPWRLSEVLAIALSQQLQFLRDLRERISFRGICMPTEAEKFQNAWREEPRILWQRGARVLFCSRQYLINTER